MNGCDARQPVTPICEPLEDRTLLAVAFATPLAPSYMLGSSPLAIPIDVLASSSTDQVVTTIRADSGLSFEQETSTTFARFNIVAADGTTSMGSIVVQLFPDRAPEAVQRFVTLATMHVNGDGSTQAPTAGAPAFYTSMQVFRLGDGFMFQSGDPVNNDSTGGSPLPDFGVETDPWLSFAGRGVLAFANTGAPNSNNSQFFITDGAYLGGNGNYTIFGQVISGWDALNAVMATPSDPYSNYMVDPADRPVITSVDIFTDTQDSTLLVQRQAGFTDDAQLTAIVYNNTQGGSTSEITRMVSSTDGDTISEYGQIDMDTVVSGNRLYVAGAYGIRVYGLDDPAHPSLLGEYNAVQFTRQLCVSGTTIYAADWGSIKILDASDPANITFVASITRASTSFFGLAVSGNTLLGAALDAGLIAYDISNPAAPVERGALKTLATNLSFNQVTAVQIVGRYAYVVDLAAMYVIDISNLSAMRLATSQSFVNIQYGIPFGLDVVGKRLYQSDLNYGLVVWDLTLPTAPKPVSVIDAGAGNWPQVRVVGNAAYVTGSNGLRVVDVTDPKHLTVDYGVIAQSQNSGADTSTRAAVYGSYLYVPQTFAGTDVVQASDIINRLTVRSGTVTVYSGAAWTRVTMTGGMAHIFTSGIGSGAVERIEVVESTDTSALTVSASSPIWIHSLRTAWSIGTISARGIGIDGDLYVRGNLRTLYMGNLANADLYVRGRPGGPAINMTLGSVSDTDIETVVQPIGTLNVTQWADTGGASDYLVSPYITAIVSKGTFDPDITLSLKPGALPMLGRASVGGINGATWNISGGAGALTIGGATGWQGLFGAGTVTSIVSRGSVLGNLSAGAITTVNVTGTVGGGTWTLGLARTVIIGTADATWTGNLGPVTTFIVTTYSANVTAYSIGAMTVRGSMIGGSLYLTQAPITLPRVVYDLNSLYVIGMISGTQIVSDGHLGTLNIGALIGGAGIYAGNSGPGLPATAPVDTIINNLTLRGLRGIASMSNAYVSARRINTANLGAPDTATGTDYGLAAAYYSRVSYRTAAGYYSWPKLGQPDPLGSGNLQIVRLV